MSRSAVDFFRDLFGGADVKSLSSRYIGFRLERVILALAQKDLNDRLCSCKDRLMLLFRNECFLHKASTDA